MTAVRAIKALGQNFLVDRNVIERIMAVVDPRETDRILEIGPGQGALTRLLAARAGQVVAVELDRRLVPLLRSEFAANPGVQVVEADILKVDLPELLGHGEAGPWKVAANLPYNISSQVLFKFLDTPQLFSSLVLMLQKEVGDRLAAPPACKDYGILSVFCQLWFDIRREILVRPGSFHPVPKVDSVVISLKPLPQARVDVGDERFFRRLVKAAFSQRRKTLWNCLKGADLGIDAEALAQALQDCDVEAGRRGETLSLQEFGRLSLRLQEQLPG